MIETPLRFFKISVPGPVGILLMSSFYGMIFGVLRYVSLCLGSEEAIVIPWRRIAYLTFTFAIFGALCVFGFLAYLRLSM